MNLQPEGALGSRGCGGKARARQALRYETVGVGRAGDSEDVPGGVGKNFDDQGFYGSGRQATLANLDRTSWREEIGFLSDVHNRRISIEFDQGSKQ